MNPRWFTPPPAPPPPRPGDPRLGDLLGRDLAPGRPPRVVLLGFPTDVGVRRNGGRPGAATAPTEIRRALHRLTPDARRPSPAGAIHLDRYLAPPGATRPDRYLAPPGAAPPRAAPAAVAPADRYLAPVEAGDPLDKWLALTEDRGDLIVGGDLEADQERLGDVVAEIVDFGGFPVVLGGGHETAYGHFLGYVKRAAAGTGGVTMLNFDAHADVREPVAAGGHSGSPFRQALLHPAGVAQRYVVAGLLPWSVSREHVAFVRAHGQALFRDQLSVAALPDLFDGLGPGPVMASFDIDAVEGAGAPGVSAPSTGGLGVDLWLAAAHHAGRCPAVSSFDLVETNPAVDRDGQTARLAAVTIWSLLRGLADRAP